MKKLIALIAAGLMILSMAGCSSKCKASGCSKDVYQNGYCELHYLEAELEKGLNELEGLFG